MIDIHFNLFEYVVCFGSLGLLVWGLYCQFREIWDGTEL